MDDKKDVMDPVEAQGVSERLTRTLTMMSQRSGIPDLDAAALAKIQSRASHSRQVRIFALAGGIILILAAIVGLGYAWNHSSEPAGQSLPTQGARDSESVIPPPEGMRWENYGNVAVAVPASWGYTQAPRDGLCPLVTGPYVDRGNEGTQPSPTVPCTDSIQVTHVTFTDADSPPPWHPVSEQWLENSRIISNVRISVTYSLNNSGLAEQILDSAHEI